MLATDRITPYRAYTPRTVTLPDGSERAVADRMSLKEFENFPWPAGERWELIWGAPVMTPSPQPSHQDLVTELAFAIKQGVKFMPGLKMFQGVDVRLPAGESYVCPDIMVIPFEGDISTARVPLTELPKLVVEVLSPSTSSNDLGAKRELYAKSGVPEYWVVEPRNTSLLIHTAPTEGSYEDVIPDAEGYTRSPTLGKRIRIRHAEYAFEVDVID